MEYELEIQVDPPVTTIKKITRTGAPIRQRLEKSKHDPASTPSPALRMWVRVPPSLR